MSGAHSIIEWHGDHGGHKCGYCRSPNTNISHGMSAYKLAAEDYQDLIDRGWRRSGTYLYKPTMKTTCCPMYPIRCDALNLKLTKSHRQTIKRVNKFLNYGIKPKEDPEGVKRGGGKEGGSAKGRVTGGIGVEGEIVVGGVGERREGESKLAASIPHTPRPGVGADPNKPRCLKAKEKRILKLGSKQSTSAAHVTNTACDGGRSIEQPSGSGQMKKPPGSGDGNDRVKTTSLKRAGDDKKSCRSLEELLGDIIETPAHRLEVRLVDYESSKFIDSFSATHKLYVKYQMNVHGDKESKCTRRQFEGFLVESPLVQGYAGGSVQYRYGSYHHQYLLDDQLIAVGVLDILPHCVSSVYLYYDPDYSFLSLGTYSALRELALVRHIHESIPSVVHYYLGFYIHTCPKMRYKGQYKPSYLCCPETYTWHSIDECVVKLNDNKYCRFADQKQVDEYGEVSVDRVLCLSNKKSISFMDYRKLNPRGAALICVNLATYARLVGSRIAQRMLFFVGHG